MLKGREIASRWFPALINPTGQRFCAVKNFSAYQFKTGARGASFEFPLCELCTAIYENLRASRKLSGVRTSEGGFQTRHYKFEFLFAFFALFAVNQSDSEIFFGCGSVALGTLWCKSYSYQRK